MPAHARAAVIAMKARAKNGDASYLLQIPVLLILKTFCTMSTRKNEVRHRAMTY